MAKRGKRSKTKKPKYYISEGWWAGWYGIHQKANNVIVAICPDRAMAEMILDFLNNLPASVLPFVYAQQRQRKDDEK